MWVTPLVVLLAGLAWLLLPAPDPLFHGKPESVWIKSIVYNGDENQTRQWREFGPEGVRVLVGNGHLMGPSYQTIGVN